MLNRPHSITADVEIPDGGAEGVLLCQGTATGGYSLFVKDNTLHYVHNYVDREIFRVAPTSPSHPADTHSASSSNRPATWTSPRAWSPRTFQLYIDGALVGETDVPYTTPIAYNPGGLTCGANPGSTITDDYRGRSGSPAPCTPSPSMSAGKLIPTPKPR